MSFSWSAPQVTPEQETLERESMSSEERATIVADIYGSNNSSVDENIDAISDVHMHISLISSDEKVAYLEANERCPDLVATESNAMTFLRADRYSPESAARRLVKYWEWRRTIFGELAFLPMTQQGALSEEVDRLTLSKGVITVQGKDEHGRAVMHYHRTRMDKATGTRDSILRVIFFMLHTATMADETVQKNGVVFLASYDKYDIYKHFDRILTKKAVCMVMEALPLQVKAVHICLPILSHSFLNVAFPVLKHILGRYLRLHMLLHAKPGPGFVREMEQFGVNIKNIPFVLGGAFLHEDYLIWLRAKEHPVVLPQPRVAGEEPEVRQPARAA